MAKYGSFLYGTAKYGTASKLSYSVEPMSIIVVDFYKTYVSWQLPKGNFSRIRLVRNQIQYPETAEDGVIIWDEYANQGTVSRNLFKDGEDNPEQTPIVGGRPIYYAVFLFTDANIWFRAGKISDVTPSLHNTKQNMVDIIPRVYTSDIYSPLGVVNETSPLIKFLDGFSFTLEQFKTYIDLLRPKHTADITSDKLLFSEFINKGLDLEPNIPLRNQKMLVREAFYMYSYKGTLGGLGTYTESLTGYAPDIIVSPNLLLTIQDSSFYQSTGNWVTSGCTLAASTAQVPVSTSYVIDNSYSGLVTATGSSNIQLGAVDPIRKGIPVVGGNDYTFSYKVKSPSSAGTTQMVVTWYDKDNLVTGSSFSMTAVSANNTWKTSWQNTTAPSAASYAVLKITFSASGVYYVDQVYAQSGINSDNTTYQEARAIDIFLEPNKTNYIKNPSFELNVTDSWTKTGSATVTQDTSVPTDAYTGTKSAKVIATGSWTYTANYAPMTAGIYYTFSTYAKTTGSFTVNAKTYNSVSALVNTFTKTFTGNGTWQRYTFTVLSDVNSGATSIQVGLSGTTSTTYNFDCVQLEQSPKATDYFDASLPSQFGAVWEGTANNSYTRLYYGKPFKVPRLARNLFSWVPSNSFWRLRTYAGVEYTNLTV